MSTQGHTQDHNNIAVDTESSKFRTFNSNNNVGTSSSSKADKPRNDKLEQADIVDGIASYLCRKFNSPESHAFYCKAAWRMSPAELYTLAEYAMSKATKTPARYFGWLVTYKLHKLGK